MKNVIIFSKVYLIFVTSYSDYFLIFFVLQFEMYGHTSENILDSNFDIAFTNTPSIKLTLETHICKFEHWINLTLPLLLVWKLN